MSTGPWEGGKGFRPRKYNVSKYLDNYERIFGNASDKEHKEQTNEMGALEADPRNREEADAERHES